MQTFAITMHSGGAREYIMHVSALVSLHDGFALLCSTLVSFALLGSALLPCVNSCPAPRCSLSVCLKLFLFVGVSDWSCEEAAPVQDPCQAATKQQQRRSSATSILQSEQRRSGFACVVKNQ